MLPEKLKRRTWFDHRQAYAPRIWPVVLVTAPLGGFIGWIGGHYFDWSGAIAAFVVSALVGYGITALVWRRWRKQHPVIPPEQLLDLYRRKAPLN
jgi:membrane associated rhomboid family serine protease